MQQIIRQEHSKAQTNKTVAWIGTDHYDTFLKEFGLNLCRIRKEKGLSLEAVANEAEIEYRQLGRIERGEVNTTVISLLRIA